MYSTYHVYAQFAILELQGDYDVSLVDIEPSRDEARNSEIDDGYYQLIVYGRQPLNRRQPTASLEASPSREMAASMFPPGTFFNVGGEPMLPGSGGGFPPTVGQEVASSENDNVDAHVSTVKMYIYM